MEMGIRPPSAARLQREVFAHIPLAAAMRISVEDYRPGRLVLAAPFDINRNHEDFAFGGAIECLATLAGWGLVWLTLATPEASIVIYRVETRFCEPIVGTLRATAVAPPSSDWAHFSKLLARHRRAGVDVTVGVGTDRNPACAEFRGRYGVTTRARQRPAVKSGAAVWVASGPASTPL